MKGQYTADKFSDGKNKQNAQKSLNNYIRQLEIHFELSNEDVINMLNSVIKNKKSVEFDKKWWHIFK
ncbi:MAG: hypothetical protein PHV68_09520 [Candidatus Gastranaerophilales bacterium]|nr:hypothetical protein [Candidatus Gastranaerophilales bacterium]